MTRRTVRRTLGCMACGVVLSVLWACTPTERPEAPITSAADRTDVVIAGDGPIVNADWPFWPVQMRLHPLTMRSTDPHSDQPIIEARVEMTDQFGDTTKCLAQVRFELHRREPNGSDTLSRLWNADLRILEQNELHYDRVTQTYLFRLGLDDGAIVEGQDVPHLTAYVYSVTGRAFESTIRLR